MNLKKSYYYVFYKFYKITKESPSIFPSDFGASVIISLLELWSLLSLKIYYKYFNRDDITTFLSFQVLIPVIAIIVVNNVLFLDSNSYKKYFAEFDKYSKEKNLKGSKIVGAIIILALVNFGFSLYLIGKINGKY